MALYRGNKYRNKKIEWGGMTFDSKKEWKRYCELKILEKAGAISGLQTQVAFELIPSLTICGKTMRRILYIADFLYTENGQPVVEDVKSGFTAALPVYQIKKRLMKMRHDIEIREV